MKILFTFFLIFSLFGCATKKIAPVGSQVSTVYSAPATYSDHRSQQTFFNSSGGRVAFTDHGQGTPLILIHGVPTSSWLYRKIIPELQNHMRVISVDLLGYGSSDKPKSNGRNYLPQAQANYIEELLAHLNIDNYAVMMHDMGGLVAWELLRDAPQRVTHLIIQNTIVRKEGFNHPKIPPGMITRQVTQAYSNALTSSAILETSFNSLGLGGDYRLSEAECFGYVKPMIEGSSEALYTFFSSINEELYEKLASNKTVFNQYQGKTLILWGAKDTILTTEQIPFLTENLSVLPQDVNIYQSHKHFLVEEIPEEVIQTVSKFMQRH